jgi:hypothetical protein
VTPYILFLAIRHRSLTLFTVANPGIPSGGFVGESKSAILSHLAPVPEFAVLREDLSVPDAHSSGEGIPVCGLSYPIVLKPDVGERGTGVVIAKEMVTWRRTSEPPSATRLSRYVAGVEFGVSTIATRTRVAGAFSPSPISAFPR